MYRLRRVYKCVLVLIRVLRLFVLSPDLISSENLFAGVAWVPVPETSRYHRYAYPSNTCTRRIRVPVEYVYPSNTCSRRTRVAVEHVYPSNTCTRRIRVPVEYVYPSNTCTRRIRVPVEYVYPSNTCTCRTRVPVEYLSSTYPSKMGI